MAKVSPLINNFSAGEFGPLTSARVDLDRYGQSAEEMTNFIPTVQGAAQKRHGTKYVGNAAVSTGNVRLQSFVFSNDQAYVLEFSATTIRFYTEGAQIVDGSNNPIEVTTPYGSDDVFELSFTQSNDILYIFHPDYAPRKLIRSSDTAWGLTQFDFAYGPYTYHPFYNKPAASSLLWAISTSGASGSITISLQNGRAITGTSNNGGEVQVSFVAIAQGEPFSDGMRVYISGVTGTTEANGTWNVRKVSNTQYVLIGSVYANAYIAGGTITYAAFSSTDVGRYVRILDYNAAPDVWVYSIITAYTSPISVTATVNPISSFSVSPATWDGQLSAWGLNVYSSTDGYPSAGCFFEDRLWMVGPLQNVICSETGDYESFRLTEDDNSVIDSNGIFFKLNTNQASSCKWVIPDEKGLLVGTSGSEFLIKSASTTSPITPTSIEAKQTTAFGSANIQPVKAGKAVVFAQASGRKLREFNYFFDVDGFRCQDLNQLAHHIAKTGIKQIAIQKQPEQIVWAVRNDGVLLGMTYERDIDGLRVAWHKHILGGSKNANGDEVDVLSVACIPTDDNSYDEVWMVVGRLIDGTYEYSIEYLDQPFGEETEQEDSVFLDCSLTYDSPKTITGITSADPVVVTSNSHGFADGDYVRIDDVEGMTELNGNVYKIDNKTANTFELFDFDGNNIDGTLFATYFSGGEVRKLVTTISGLSHLNGQQVVAYADGAKDGVHTVSAGAITLNERAAVVTVGLSYDAKIKLPRLEAGSQDGTSLGKTRRVHRLGAAVYRTLGLKYGQDFDDMQSFEFQDGDDQLNQAPPLYTGILTTEVEFDYDFNNNICLKHDEPSNCTLLAVMPQMNTQDR